MITYGIIEDQKPISDALILSIKKLRPEYQCLFVYSAVRDANEYLHQHVHPDLLFVDVELEDGVCFDLFHDIDITSSVIFTTAFSDKVLEAFHMHQSIDYLVKPYADSDLLNSITKFEKVGRENNFESTQSNRISSIADELLSLMKSSSTSKPQRILAVIGDRYESIAVSNIGWLASKEKYVMMITKDGKELFTTFASLNEAEEALPTDIFFRANRKYIVNIDNIITVNKSFGGKLKLCIGTNSMKENIMIPFAKRLSFLSWYGAGKY